MGILIKSLALVFFSTNVWAGVLAVTVTGASGIAVVGGSTTPATTPGTPATTTQGSVTVFGSMPALAVAPATQVTCPVQDGINPCNNCPAQAAAGCTPTALLDTTLTATNQSPLCSCQGAAIYDSLAVVVNITKPTANNALAYAMFGTLTSGTSSANVSVNNQPNSVTVPWSVICQNMTNGGTTGTVGTGSTQCETLIAGSSTTMTVFTDNANAGGVYNTNDDSVQITFKIVSPGPNENVYGTAATDGLGQFVAFPGDSRIYLTSMDTANGFPNLTDTTQAASINVYLSTVGLDNANPSDPSVILKTITVNSDGTFSQMFVDSLTNDQRYWVRVATVDQANNIIQFYPDLYANLPQALQTACAPTASNDVLRGCPYTAVPEQVLGLLSKDFNCFIATAAYGSSLEPKLKVFREFRFELLRRDWGLRLVYAYYKYGPYAARFIADKPLLRALTRGFLWPLYLFSWSSLHYGFSRSLMVSLGLLASLFALSWYGIRRWQPRD